VDRLKIALAQINPTLGDTAGNAKLVLEVLRQAQEAGAALVVFPELVTVGYPPKDLLLRTSLIRSNVEAVEQIAAACTGIAAVVGFVQPQTGASGRGSGRGISISNCAALCGQGRILARYGKRLLPTYDVFDESRYFTPGRHVCVAEYSDGNDRIKLGLTVCEDLWNDQQFDGRQVYGVDPIRETAEAGAQLLVNISASPFSDGKQALREHLFATQVRQLGLPLAYCGQVGGNDDLVFDGGSLVMNGRGEVIARARAFEEDLLVVDLASSQPGRIEPYPDRLAGLWSALRIGTRDYVRKCGFDGVVLGLSGGIDSAVTAAIAAEALGPDRVLGVAMPSRYSSDHSVEDARALAENLEIGFQIIPIREAHEAMEHALADCFQGSPADVTEENIQARVRGSILMAISNKFGRLVLSTGNKSELAVGYCTLYGDMCGGLALISDVPKTTVYELARWVNQRHGRALIPENTIVKPPSAELREDQTDQDSLPPYDVLDAVLERYVEKDESVDEIVAQGFEPQTVQWIARAVDRNEYKRKQAAVGIKVTTRAFGTGRRMPIAARYG